jgi:serine/threonine protein kinase
MAHLTFQHYTVCSKPDGTPHELGRGAMGVTYLAKDSLLDRFSALKVISENIIEHPSTHQRFLREARSAAKVNHPNVAAVYHCGEVEGQFFYAMEYVQGESLADHLQRSGPLPPAQAVRIAIDVCRGLSAAASQGLIHRDIKPANIMLTEQDGVLTPKVIDFGLAKPGANAHGTNQDITVAGFLGTPLYASPEQLREDEDLDLRSDIYSLGVTLWVMLTGAPPYQGSLFSLVQQHQVGALPLHKLPPLPSELIQVLEKALALDREDRFATAEDFRQALEATLPSLENQALDLSDAETLLDAEMGCAPDPTPAVRAKSAVSTSPVSGEAPNFLSPSFLGAQQEPALPKTPSLPTLPQIIPTSMPNSPSSSHYSLDSLPALAKHLYQNNQSWRTVCEAVGIGVVVLLTMAIFSPSNNQAAAQPSATYQPPANQSAAPVAQASTAPASPSSTSSGPMISTQQLQAIQAASGNNNILTPLRIEPQRLTPAASLDEVEIDSRSTDNFGRLPSQKR